MSRTKKPPSPAVHLREGNKEKILKLLEQWQGRLNWDPFLDAVEKITGHRYSRQALMNHERIRILWLARKNELKHRAEKEEQQKGSLGVIAALEKRDRLQREVDHLKIVLNDYDQMFQRWIHNARLAGLDPEHLNRPLDPIDREATEPASRPKRGTRRSRG